MKPLRIEFQAFGPYEGKETVDFEKLAEHGVFLICGNTGSGKTMILDAMTYALYGDSSGHGNGREKIENMRCTSADPDVPTFVRLEFENQGRVYLFERVYAKKRTAFHVSCMAKRKNKDGEWEVLFENPKERDLNDEAKRIIGLSYDQFRQVIVLPQGQFEKLLTSKSDDKEEILTTIFHAEKWSGIAKKFYEEAENRKAALDSVKKEMELLLQGENCESIGDLTELIEKKKMERKKLDREFAESGNEARYEGLKERMQLYSELHEEETALEDKMKEKGKRDEWDMQLQRATAAESLRELLNEVTRMTEELTTATKQKENLERQATEASMSATTTGRELQIHQAKEPEIQKTKKRQLELEGKRSDYEQIDIVNEEYISKKCVVNTVEKEENNCRKALTKAEKDRKEIEDSYLRMTDEYHNLFGRYSSGQIYDIRSRLKENEPCPICGVIVDREHYHLAMSENEKSDKVDIVTKEELDIKKHILDEKDSSLKDAVERRNDIQVKLTKKQEELTEHQRELAAIEGRLQAIKSSLIQGISSTSELEDEIASCVQRSKEYHDREKELAEKEQTAREISIRLKAQQDENEKSLHNLEQKLRNVESTLDKTLCDSIFHDREEAAAALLDPEIRIQLQKNVNTYDTEVKTLQDRCNRIQDDLKRKGDFDEDICREQLLQAESDIETYKKECYERDLVLTDLEKTEKRVRETSKGMADELARAEEELIFAKQLQGHTGIGLHRYVLGIMLADVVDAANQMLEKVHGGRYRLYRGDDKVRGSYKKGLDLKVHDSYTEAAEGRFVGTMSGGEKFLASLSLAIGMSTVAQKKGIKIEALFIDEGFGSLSEDSIGDAMDILKGLQKSSGMVGIISHVKLMQDSISTKLIVDSGEHGSHIHTSIG